MLYWHEREARVHATLVTRKEKGGEGTESDVGTRRTTYKESNWIQSATHRLYDDVS